MIVNRLFTTLGAFVDTLVLPATCAACGVYTGKAQLCAECLDEVRYLTPPVCELCGLPLAEDSPAQQQLCSRCQMRPPAFDRARSAVRYEGVVRYLIHRLKFSRKAYVARALAELAQETFVSELALLKRQGKEVLIIPIPLHWRRLWRRGFNQSALLARFVAGKERKLIKEKALRRVKATPPLARQTRAQRPTTIASAFFARPSLVKGKAILLLDDLMTTASTLSEAAKALKAAGAVRVHCFTIARAVKHGTS